MKRILLLTLSVLAAVDVSARAVFNFYDYHKDGADYFETMSKIVELVRARNGVIENNFIDGGSGVVISNEMGQLV